LPVDRTILAINNTAINNTAMNTTRDDDQLTQLATHIRDRAPKILVIGDAILDTWLTGAANRISREAPVPVVEVTERRAVPGGAANAAVALAALGARTTLCALIGDDPEGAELCTALNERGVDTATLVVGARATASKQRVLGSGTVLARWDRAPRTAPSGPDATTLAARVASALDERPDAVLVCDYDAGGVPDQVLAVLRGQRDRIGQLVVDAHWLARWAPLDPDLVTPNAAEATALLGEPVDTAPDRADRLCARRAELLRRASATAAVVTLDRDGALLLPADPAAPIHRVATNPAPEEQTCGTGDVFAAALAAALGAGGRPSAIPLAVVRFAQAAAEAAIRAAAERPGTAALTAEAMAARLAPARRTPLDTDALIAAVAEHRRAGRRIVFTNGCFDVLHRGHVAYLERAKQLGDVLIVALNSDGSVTRLKGPERPVNPVADRASVIAALRCVDHVVVFEEDTPVRLLELVRPEVYAKGGDYTAAMLPETPVVRRLGGEVRVLDYLSDHSTSAIVRRIRDRAVS